MAPPKAGTCPFSRFAKEFFFLTDVYGSEDFVAEVRVEYEKGALYQTHDQELEWVQFAEDRAERDQNRCRGQATFQNPVDGRLKKQF